jgi:hypothetical protein
MRSSKSTRSIVEAGTTTFRPKIHGPVSTTM